MSKYNFSAHFSHLVKINESLNRGAYDNYKKSGLTYVDVPEMVGITGACENVDTLFKVKNRFDLPLFFTQTGQLSLEQSLQSLPGVFTVIHSGRDEEQEDERHLRQFRLTEEEFDCTLAGMKRNNYDEEKMFSSLLDHIQSTIQSMVLRVLRENETVLKKFYKRDINKLRLTIKRNFYRIPYEEAIKLLNSQGFPDLRFGDDLKADHEAKIVSLLNKKNDEIPVFITKYPKEIKFFNMKVSERDQRVVLSADLIFPYSGEGTGSAVREHDFDKLKNRLLGSTMYRLHIGRGGRYADFKWYLDIIKSKKSQPHAGYGIGNERVIQYILGIRDIRQASLFSLLANETGDWDRNKYGKGALITKTNQKHILLTIGEPRNKKTLYPLIRELAGDSSCVFYATEKTHRFLKERNIMTSLVYKISETDKGPNISDLLKRKIFDLVINIPSRDSKVDKGSITDGKLIRREALSTGTYLITDMEVTDMVLRNLKNGSG